MRRHVRFATQVSGLLVKYTTVRDTVARQGGQGSVAQTFGSVILPLRSPKSLPARPRILVLLFFSNLRGTGGARSLRVSNHDYLKTGCHKVSRTPAGITQPLEMPQGTPKKTLSWQAWVPEGPKQQLFSRGQEAAGESRGFFRDRGEGAAASRP